MKYRIITTFIAAFAIGITTHAGMPVEQGDIPVAPIAKGNVLGWQDVFHLSNPAMELIIDPAQGSIVHMKVNQGEEFLGNSSPPGDTGKQGNWLWPVDKTNWDGEEDAKTLPAYLTGQPWDANAWVGADGSQSCRMTHRYGPPINVRVTRTIKLDEHQQMVSVRQRIERTDESDIPVLLWNVTRITNPGHAILPIDEPAGYSRDGLIPCDDTVVCDTTHPRDDKVCAASTRNWIAAQKGEFVMIQKVHGISSPSDFTGDCRVALTTKRESQYLQTETRSEEMDLEVGDSIENTVSIRCYALETNMPACRLSQQISSLLRER